LRGTSWRLNLFPADTTNFRNAHSKATALRGVEKDSKRNGPRQSFLTAAIIEKPASRPAAYPTRWSCLICYLA
jgi:hypothetical protein